MRIKWAVLLGVFFTLALAARAEDATTLKDRLHRAENLNSLDDTTMKPWYLKLSFQLFDKKGKPTEQGAIEEWWQSPTIYKVTYTSPSFSGTELRTPEGTYNSKGTTTPPYLLDLVLRGVVHPLSKSEIDDSAPNLKKKSIDKVSMDCIMLAQPIQGMTTPPLGLFPTYCFDNDKDALRAGLDFGTQVTVRNTLDTFQQHSVPVDQDVSNDRVKSITAHIETLREESFQKSDFTPSAEMDNVDPQPQKVPGSPDLVYVKVAGGILQGSLVSWVPPVYPLGAKESHITGIVVLKAIIGKDGHIHSLKPISAPDRDLTLAAIAAVRQWTYKPYMLNGRPVAVDTTINVNFGR